MLSEIKIHLQQKLSTYLLFGKCKHKGIFKVRKNTFVQNKTYLQFGMSPHKSCFNTICVPTSICVSMYLWFSQSDP